MFGKSAMAPQKAEGRLQHFSAWLSTISYNFGLSMELDSCHVRRSRSIMAGVNLSFHGSPNTALENSLVLSLSLSITCINFQTLHNIMTSHLQRRSSLKQDLEANLGGRSGSTLVSITKSKTVHIDILTHSWKHRHTNTGRPYAILKYSKYKCVRV